MSRYETYKPSCIDWIGNVPEHWERKRFRYCFENSKGLSITKENLIEVGIPCVNYGEIHSKYGFKVDPEVNELLCVDKKYLETNQSSILSEGDFVFADTSEDIEGSGNFTHLIGNQKIFAGYHTIISRLRIKSAPKFVAYYFESVSFRNQIRREIQGVKVFSITNKILKNTILFLPEYDEQLAIANYLDHQTQKIDCLIANKKAQAEKLKELRQIEINNAVTKGLNPNAEMKDSGIEWLGKIPMHWEVKRLKNILIEKMMYGANEIADDDNENNPRYIRITDFGSNGELRDDTFKSLPMEVAKDYLLREGDILFARSGATVGKTFQFKNYSGIACFAGYLIKARANNQIITSDFLFYFTQSNAYENWKNSIFSKATIENIGADKYQLLKLCVPNSIEEQNEITEYLIKRTTAIDQLIKNIEAQIEKLQELRKIKIYEAVTGKIKVNRYE